jgi:hypothetical protein
MLGNLRHPHRWPGPEQQQQLQSVVNGVQRVGGPVRGDGGRRAYCHVITVRATAFRQALEVTADAVEDAVWAAWRDPSTGYGIAVLHVGPGGPHPMSSSTVTQYRAPDADPVNPASGKAGAPAPD